MHIIRPWNDRKQFSRGFTLVEVLIVVVLGVIITAAVIGVLYSFIFSFEQTDDITTARQRGEMVLSILEGPILHAGLGMPSSLDQFSGLTLLNTWTSPVEIPTGVNSGEIRLVYSVPTEIYQDSEVSFDSGDITLSLKSPSDNDVDLVTDLALVDTISNTTKAWILFPTANSCFRVKGNDTVEPSSAGSGMIAQYDRLHYLRALEAKVENGEFKVRDIVNSASTFQPTVEGIQKICFVLDKDVLSVYVLARGNKLDNDLDLTRPISGWDDSILPTIDQDLKKYRLSVVKGSWRIRN
ncbi:MAG: prepilin-type N-terminal cleavage/methylation domain-containing protein [Synergistales bacterium]|nr:prepilin-type N-terminal cleavage/methylation domain-containing protein [Synergistales bacterium]